MQNRRRPGGDLGLWLQPRKRGAQLRVGFEVVDRVDCPANAFLVTDVDALAAYLASVGDLYESEVATWMTWGEVVEECRRRAALIVNAHGAFRISTSIGAFVCR